MAESNEIERLRSQVESETREEGDEEGQETKFEDGFTSKTVFGSLFIAFIMLPGALYLGLVAGQGLGPAAEWVTIVLFAEIMRRSFLPMKRQEVYILYYIAAGLTALADKGISGGPFGQLIWRQYFVQSPQAAVIARDIPHWVVPAAGSMALQQRTFLHWDWFWPIIILLINEVLGRLNWNAAGYFLFRITSDIERLPFPMAPVAASGATALAEAASKEESWRWRVFSIGAVIGMIFGFFYIAIPVFTGVVFGKAFTLIPIPFFDLTTNTETILPGAITGISGDITKILTGFVIPYDIVLGSLMGSVFCRVLIARPLQMGGFFGSSDSNGWTRGMDAIYTKQATDIKFWLSIGIGLQVAVALIGFYSVFRAFASMRNDIKNKGLNTRVPKGRGDLPLWIPFAIWLVVTVFYIGLTQYLLGLSGHSFPLWILVFYGLVWSPINSYVSARMVGLTGSGVSFPYLKEVSVMKSGYQYADIWYAPIPLNDFGGAAQKFREVELTGTKFVSVVKVEALMTPVIFIASFVFWAFFWHTSQIPSSQHPYAAKFWPISATFEALFQTINRQQGGITWVKEAINFPRIGGGVAAGLALYGIFGLFKLPVLIFYGFIGGSGSFPHDVIPTFFGAWLGRKYFAKRFGLENWRMYTPVLLAGFSCGTGLVAMASIALALIAKSVNYLPF